LRHLEALWLLRSDITPMRAAGIRTYGGGPVQVFELLEPEVPQPDQLLLEVYAGGVGNCDDIVQTAGWDTGLAPPIALGVSLCKSAFAHLRTFLDPPAEPRSHGNEESPRSA
jgi:hypothetical protein